MRVVQIALHRFDSSQLNRQWFYASILQIALRKLRFPQPRRGMLVLSDQHMSNFMGQNMTQNDAKSCCGAALMLKTAVGCCSRICSSIRPTPDHKGICH